MCSEFSLHHGVASIGETVRKTITAAVETSHKCTVCIVSRTYASKQRAYMSNWNWNTTVSRMQHPWNRFILVFFTCKYATTYRFIAHLIGGEQVKSKHCEKQTRIKLCRCRGTARRATNTKNPLHVKACNRKWPSRRLKVIAIAAVRYVVYYLLLVACSNISILHRFRDITAYFPKLKEATWPQPHPHPGHCHPKANPSHSQPVNEISSPLL